MKYFIKHYILPLIAIRPLQPVYSLLHRIALTGMNIGPVGEVATSGEARLARKIMKGTPAGAVIMDVGANLGEFALHCARYAPPAARIFAFEPSPTIYNKLQANIQNSARPQVIFPVPVGLSDQSREGTIFVKTGLEGASSLHTRHQAHLREAAKAEPVRLTTLDEFCSERDLPRIHFLKIDIEGEEFACLQGAKKLLAESRIDYLQFEFGGCDIQARIFMKDFWDLLSPGYDLYRILQNSLWPVTRYHELLEIFTTTNYLAVRRPLPAPR